MKIKNIFEKNNIMLILTCAFILSLLIFNYTPLSRIMLIVYFLGSLACYGFDLFKFKTISVIYLILLIYFSVYTFCGLSIDTKSSLQYIPTMIINLCMIVCLSKYLKDNNTIEFIMRIYILCSLLGCIYIIVSDYSNIFTGKLGQNVNKPFFNSKYSHTDISLIAAISIVFLQYFYFKKSHRVIDIILNLFFLVFIILTGSRKPFLVALVALILYPFILNIHKDDITKKFLYFAIILILFGLVYYALINNKFLYNIIGNRFEGFIHGLFNGGEFQESSAKSRGQMIRVAFSLFEKSPIFGYGLNTFRTFEGSFNTWSHNNFLELVVSGGVVASIIYYYLYFSFVKRLCKIRHSNLKTMIIILLISMIIIDLLSVSYISRLDLLVLTLIDSYLYANDNIKNYKARYLDHINIVTK